MCHRIRVIEVEGKRMFVLYLDAFNFGQYWRKVMSDNYQFFDPNRHALVINKNGNYPIAVSLYVSRKT